VTLDVSTYRREFTFLRDHGEIEEVQSALGVGKVRHNWLEMKDFSFGLLACEFDGIAFANATTTSSTVWKEGLHGDFVTIEQINEGRGIVTLADTSLELSAGDTYALSMEQKFKCHTPLYQNISHIAIPRMYLRQAGLAEKTLQPKGAFAPPGCATDVLFDFFQSFALRVENGPALSRKAMASVKDSIIGMAAAMLEENDPAVLPMLYSAAKDYIDDHLQDPELGASTVAAALHISKRSLYRLFAEKDQSLASYIRTARLQGVKRELETAGEAARIRDVIGRWGFTPGGHFSQVFQKEFGLSPMKFVKSL
jgi:AraC-like DNA-binding protein